MRQDRNSVCTVCNRCLYKRSIRLSEHKKYRIFTAEVYCSVSSFDGIIYVSDTCHKHLSRNEIPCQTVFNKMSLDSISDELNNSKK